MNGSPQLQLSCENFGLHTNEIVFLCFHFDVKNEIVIALKILTFENNLVSFNLVHSRRLASEKKILSLKLQL